MKKDKLFIKQYTKETEIGKQYGSLKIVDFIEHHVVDGKKIVARVIVKCINCNSEPYETRHNYLVKPCNPVRSCGCLNSGRITHGLKHHPYYNNCQGAIYRCYPGNKHHPYYYDRGIRCFWTMNTIAKFIKYLEDNLPPRRDQESLDRIDNDKGYEPGNLRWASKKEQTLNRRSKISNHQYDQLKKENDILRCEIIKLQAEVEKLRLEIKTNFGDR